MNEIDLKTDTELIEILRDRLEAKELAYLFAWGIDDGEEYMLTHNLDHGLAGDIYEDITDDIADEIINTADWNPTEDELLQWKADTEEEEEED
jgi:hypothetical protein